MIAMLSREQVRANLGSSLKALEPAISTSIDTDEGALIETLVDAILGHEYRAQGIQDDQFITSATATEALDKHADARFAGGRKVATTTLNCLEALRVWGSVGATFAVGDALVHTDGTRYQITKAGTIGALGAALADVQSISTGTTCNKGVLEKLTFEEPPAGIQAEAIIAVKLTGATDAETNAKLLLRLIDVSRNPHAGGRASDYRQWSLEVPRTLSVYVWCPSSSALTGRRGLGCVDVAVLVPGSKSARIPSAAVVQEVQDYLDARRPAGVREVLVVTPAADEEHIDVTVTAEHGYEFDWDDGAGFTVSAWDPADPAGYKLTWSAALPAGVVANARLMVYGQYCKVLSTGADYTFVDRILVGGAGLVGKAIYPGGPLTEPVQAAILAYIDSLGPARGTAADPEQSGWEDSILLSKLFKAVLGVDGVRDVVIVTPAANVTPVDHAPAGVPDLLVAGRITVRPV